MDGIRHNKADELWFEMGFDIKYIMVDAYIYRWMLPPSNQMLGEKIPRFY